MAAVARKKKIKVGPEDHGHVMSLDDFDSADAREGYFYELNKGVIEVSGFPFPDHSRQVRDLKNQFEEFDKTNPGLIDHVGGGSDSKLLIGESQSERHPDVAVYPTECPIEGDAA